MITCWAGGTGKAGAEVTPFIDELLQELQGRAKWIKATEGVLKINSSGVPPVYQMSSVQNRGHQWGDFASLTAVPQSKLEIREVLRLDGSPDSMRTVTWNGEIKSAKVGHEPKISKPLPNTLNTTGLPASIYRYGKTTLYFYPDGRVLNMGSNFMGSYLLNDTKELITLRFSNETFELRRESEELLTGLNGERFNLQ